MVRTSANDDEYNCANGPFGERHCLPLFLAIGHPDSRPTFPDIIHKRIVFDFNIAGSAWLHNAEYFEVSTRLCVAHNWEIRW